MMSAVKNEDFEKLAKLQTEHKDTLPFEVDKNGKKRDNSPVNVALSLQEDPRLKNLIRFNRFTQGVDITRDQVLPLENGLAPVKVEQGEMTDTALNSLLLYWASNPVYKMKVNTNTAQSTVDAVANANQYNPLTEYMDRVAQDWDGKNRIELLLQTYLGADNTKINVFMFKLWLMGAVAKAYDPNIKFDYVLDLVGGQGVGKTTFLRKIAPLGLYTDEFNTFTARDDKMAFRSVLIANDDEMTASNRSSFEEIKKFITDQQFKYRQPYGHYVITFHKGFVLARTSNTIQHLKDKSGDRRFLSIECHPENQTKHPADAKSLTDAEIAQIWGEAVNMYKKAKEPFALSNKVLKALEDSRQKFLQTTDTEDAVLNVIDTLAQECHDYYSLHEQMTLGYDRDGDYFVTNQMLKQMLMKELGHDPNRKELNTMRYVMSNNHWEFGVRFLLPEHDDTKKHATGVKPRGACLPKKYIKLLKI